MPSKPISSILHLLSHPFRQRVSRIAQNRIRTHLRLLDGDLRKLNPSKTTMSDQDLLNLVARIERILGDAKRNRVGVALRTHSLIERKLKQLDRRFYQRQVARAKEIEKFEQLKKRPPIK